MNIEQTRTITAPVPHPTDEQRSAVTTMVEEALLKLGATQLHISTIRFPNAVYNTTLVLGYLPGVITLAGGIVVKGVTALLPEYHPAVRDDFVRSGDQLPHVPRFIWLTWGEAWHKGPAFNVVETDADYLEYLKYILSVGNEEIQSFVKRKRGRPPLAHKKTRESVSGYAQWIRDCASYRAQVDTQAKLVADLEVHTKQRIADLKEEHAQRVLAVKDTLRDAQLELAALRAKGAPKLIK